MIIGGVVVTCCVLARGRRVLLLLVAVAFPLFSFGDREGAQNDPFVGSHEVLDETEMANAVDDFREVRMSMVDRQIAARGVRDERVLRAMQTVPRHRFVPDEEIDRAYNDHALPIGYGQTISQPYVVAYMTELLEVDEGKRILEIGTGSGYQAAVLAELTPKVFTVEIITELAERAETALAEAGYDTVRVKRGDGYFGWEEEAPFDGILVTAAAGHVPGPLVDQLAPGGRIVIPVGRTYDVQYITVITKSVEGKLTSRQLLPVRFVPFTGEIQRKGE